MSDEDKDKIKRRLAEGNPWGKFLLATIELDKAFKKEIPNGFHWFLAFQYLTGLKLSEIQKKLPKGHPYKSKEIKNFKVKLPLETAIKKLKNELIATQDIKEINFSKLVFNEEYFDFQDFVFPIKTTFKKSVFRGETLFRNAVFCEDTDFSRVEFRNKVDFYEATFNSITSFASARFSFVTRFKSTTFVKKVNFGGANFRGAVLFDNALFYDEAFFASIEARTHIRFPDAKFKKYVPDFHDAELYSGVRWDDNPNLWPDPKKRDDSEENEKHITILKWNRNNYENLASRMKKLERHHDEHFFFRQEMGYRKELAKGNPLVYFTYWLYETFSDYGYGIGRAFSWWLGHILFGSLLLFLYCFCNPTSTFISDLSCSLGISFANAHVFLSLHKGPLEGCYRHFEDLYVFNFIWTIQIILGIAFLFMLLLTLRIRFRLK